MYYSHYFYYYFECVKRKTVKVCEYILISDNIAHALEKDEKKNPVYFYKIFVKLFYIYFNIYAIYKFICMYVFYY